MHAARFVLLQSTALFEELNYLVQLRLRMLRKEARSMYDLQWRPRAHCGLCAETDPERSSRALRPVCWHGGTWRRKQTAVYYACKQFVPHFFLCSCTCLILGLGPQTKPPSMTTHHGLVTSHCITLILRGRTIKLLSKSTAIANPRQLGTLRMPTHP